jgi:hypothetical protein
MKQTARLTALALVSAVGLTTLAPMAALASSKGRRNTAIGLGAVAAYGVVTKKPLVAGLGAAGALYSLSQSGKHNRRRHRRSTRGNLYNYNSNTYRSSDYRTRGYRTRDTSGTAGRRAWDAKVDNANHGTWRRNGDLGNGYIQPTSNSRWRSDNRSDRSDRASRRRHGSLDNSTSNPPGWSHGRKNGWHGRDVPPGHADRDR